MSSKAGKIAKGMKIGGGNHFPIEMYNTTVGSVVICGAMFTKKHDFKYIRKMWKEYKKNPDMFDFNDKKFIDKVLAYFGMTRPKYFPIAMVQSEWNVLFAPYDKKHKLLLPLREDGFTGPTLRTGKVYPIEWNKEVVHNRLWLKEKIKSFFKKLFRKE